MSENVGGRGRGWLHLNASNNMSAPGIQPLRINRSAPGNPPRTTIPAGSPPKCVNEDIIFDDVPGCELLINLVKQLNMEDDGIKCNQKMRHLLEKWTENCPTGDDVEKKFQAICQACLHDDELTSKLVYLISSRTFISQEVRSKNIRLLFLSQLQKTFDGSDSLQKSNPVAFRNCTRMLGEFFNKGRLANGDRYSFMAAPLVENLQILLESGHPQDLQLLATQLCMNESEIKAECPEQLLKLLNDARIMLIWKELTKESKLWLLLCIDGSNNKFGLLSAGLCKFYQDQLGEAFTAIIQILTIQAEQNKYQSKVNTVQVSNPIDPCAVESSQFSASDDYSSQAYTSGSSRNISGKHDRPISGIGARLVRNKLVTDASYACREDKSEWNSSTDKSSPFSTSDTSGFVSDSSSHDSRKHDRPILEGRLIRYSSEAQASSTCGEDQSGRDGKPKGGCRDKGNVNHPQVFQLDSSIDKSSQFSTSDTSGFVSDSSSHDSRKHDRPILDARLIRHSSEAQSSSTCREDQSGRDGKPKGGCRDKGSVNVPQVFQLDSSIDKSLQFSTSDTSSFISDSSSPHSVNLENCDRPSVGARRSTEAHASSTCREGNSGREGKTKGGWGKGKKYSKSSKGWQHDDRFENNYS